MNIVTHCKNLFATIFMVVTFSLVAQIADAKGNERYSFKLDKPLMVDSNWHSYKQFNEKSGKYVHMFNYRLYTLDGRDVSMETDIPMTKAKQIAKNHWDTDTVVVCKKPIKEGDYDTNPCHIFGERGTKISDMTYNIVGQYVQDTLRNQAYYTIELGD